MKLPDIQDWIDRLRKQIPEATVGGSLDLSSALASGEIISPSVYVVLASDAPDENQLVNGVQHQVAMDVAVVLLIHNWPDPDAHFGGDDLLRQVRGKIYDALMGWQAPCCDPAEYGGGSRLSGIDANLLIWQDSFLTTYWMRYLP